MDLTISTANAEENPQRTKWEGLERWPSTQELLLLEDQLVPSTLAAHMCNSSSRGWDTLFWPPWGLYPHVCAPMYMHTHIIFKNKSSWCVDVYGGCYFTFPVWKQSSKVTHRQLTQTCWCEEFQNINFVANHSWKEMPLQVWYSGSRQYFHHRSTDVGRLPGKPKIVKWPMTAVV